MLRRVKHATFHSNSNFIPGVADIGKYLPSKSKTLDSLNMTVSEVGLHVKFKHQAQDQEILFPIAAISHLVLETETHGSSPEPLESVRMKAKQAIA